MAGPPTSSSLSSEPPSLTSGPTISTSPTAQSPLTPMDRTPRQQPQPPHQRPTPAASSSGGGSNSSSTTVAFDPASSADRELARAAGMRIDTPTPYPRLLLEPHLTIELDRAKFADDPARLERAAAALLARHGGGKLLVRTTGGPDDDDDDGSGWAARRWQARAHRAANPISVASTRGAFAASISAQPPPQQQQQQQSSKKGGGGGNRRAANDTTTTPAAVVVHLPASFLATANRALSATAAAAWRLNERHADRRHHPLPLFVYGHWMFPAQMAAAVLGGSGAQRQQQPTAESVKQWTQRMLPAELLNGENNDEGGWHRYCMRGRAPTAALLERDNPRLRYYLRDVGERGAPVEGRLVLGVSAEQWGVLDEFLGVEEGDEEKRIWGKREVQVGVKVAGAKGLTKLRAVAYVWEGDPMDLHIFKVDKVWTPELYVEWHGRMRREMAVAAAAKAAGADGGAV